MLKHNDFIELEYVGKIKSGIIFDTNIKEEAKKINLEIKTRPLIICLGENMILPAIDKFLIGKSLGTYSLELNPENAFGKRKPELIKIFPINAFRAQNIVPQPGMVFAFDNMLGKINSVSGGRVTIDFNNPLAGKEIEYQLIIKREIKELDEKARALLSFYLRKDLEFKIEKNKLLVKSTKQQGLLLKLISKKFKDILGLDIEITEIPEPKPASPEEAKK